MSEQQTPPNYIELAADLVSAFVSNNPVPAAELPALIGTVHAALTKVANGSSQQPTEEPKKAPAVSVKKSVQPDYIVCLDDGKRFKSLKRHLRTTYDMTPEQYRAKWGLPASYPMVAPNYAATRSERRAGELRLGKRLSERSRSPISIEMILSSPARRHVIIHQARASDRNFMP